MDEVLKIANWNLERINPLQRRSVEILKYIKSVDADIWVLTETHESVGPTGYSACFSGDPDRVSKKGERWIGICSKWPMEPLPFYVSDPSRSAAIRVTETPFGDLIVFGCVFPWGNGWRGNPGIDGQDFEAALKLQSEDWQRLRKENPDATLIVAGDFNQDLAPNHYFGSKKKRALLELALLESGLDPLTSEATDPIFRDSSPNACIDHICISQNVGWNLKSTMRWPDSAHPILTISDHFGVGVEVTRSGH